MLPFILSWFSVVKLVRVCGLCLLCAGLGACVEGVDLPQFVTQLDFPQGRKADVSQVQERSREPVAMPENEPGKERMSTEVSSQDLLQSLGNWNIVEQSREMDPTQAHLQARERVNTGRRQKDVALSAHFHPNARSGEDGKMRVLRLEREDEIDDEAGFDLAESSVVKPTYTIVGHDLLGKIRALFGEDDEGGQSMAAGGNTQKIQSSVAVSQPERSNEEQIQTAYLASGVVAPPSLPERKASPVERQIDSHGVAIPRRKPLENSYASGVVVVPRVKPASREGGVRTSLMNGGCFDATQAHVVKIRSGRHEGKTRLVIEVSCPVKYQVAMDHVRNVLRVKIDGAVWGLELRNRFEESTLLGTYIVQEQSDGSVIFEVRLSRKSKILDTTFLRPNLSSAHRIVIDLAD
ncbi:MAG: hypothetical protein ACLFP8_05900 [Alphaproteobacteria bacterium]